jgi:hypothetical protein
MRAGQRELDSDRSGCATCAEQDNALAASVNDTFERHQESLPISILADVFVAPANCTIDSLLWSIYVQSSMCFDDSLYFHGERRPYF